MQEQEARKDWNNPGGEEVMGKVGLAQAGLPVFAFLDDRGELIVNSIRPAGGKDRGGNIGHPMEPVEVDWFMVMLKKAAPALTKEEAGIVENWLRAQKK